MTGGLSFVYDENRKLENNLNVQSVEQMRMTKGKYKKHENFLIKLVKTHYKETGSMRAKRILDNFDKEIRNFYIIKPKTSNIDDLLLIINNAA